MIYMFKVSVKEKINVRMLGTDTLFLSVHLSKPNSTTVVFDQYVQIGQMLDLFDITHETGVSTPLAKECDNPFDNNLYEQAVGHTMYAATISRPDVVCAIGKLNQRCANPTVSEWKAVKHIFKYLLKTKDLKLVYQKTGQPLKMFRDSDFAGCSVDRKSRNGYVFILAGGAVSWLLKKQPILSQLNCKAEFVAM